jgi:hypothetical protein
MRSYKTELLDYGLKKGHFTGEEYKWCMDGKNINDYKKQREYAEINLESYPVESIESKNYSSISKLNFNFLKLGEYGNIK